jgi:hypothetical protein
MRWTVACPVVALLLAASLAGCGDGEGPGAGGPTRSPTFELPSPTRTGPSEDTGEAEPSQTPTREPEPSEDTPSPSDRSPGGTSDRPTLRPSEQPSEQPSEEPSQEPSQESSESTAPPSDGDQADDENVPAGLWWLLGAVALGAVAAVPLVVRARRRAAWRRQLSEAEGELGWLARELLPGLRHVGSREQVAGGWSVALPRVAAAEDRLTVLEASAYDDGSRERARALRDASRLARARMDQLVGPGAHDTWSLDLDAIMADLAAALGPPRTAPA